MRKENLTMGKYNLRLQGNEQMLSIFSRKNGEIYFCIDQGDTESKYILNSNSAKIIGEKLIELSKSSAILEKCHNAKSQEKSYHHSPEITMEAVENLLDEIVNQKINKQNY